MFCSSMNPIYDVSLDIDECFTEMDNCNRTFASCFNTVGSFVCECNEGYVDRSADLDPSGTTCVPVFDECYFGISPVCHKLASCSNDNPPRESLALLELSISRYCFALAA